MHVATPKRARLERCTSRRTDVRDARLAHATCVAECGCTSARSNVHRHHTVLYGQRLIYFSTFYTFALSIRERLPHARVRTARRVHADRSHVSWTRKDLLGVQYVPPSCQCCTCSLVRMLVREFSFYCTREYSCSPPESVRSAACAQWVVSGHVSCHRGKRGNSPRARVHSRARLYPNATSCD